jgi:predicted amidohydrolase YtcJ
VYVNGTVVTMDPAGHTAQAVAIRGDQILAVGTNDEIRKLAAPSATVVNLAGKVMLPGLYAAHDHFPGAGTVAVHRVDLNSPPIGKMETIASIIEALKQRARVTPSGQWVFGRGYDDTLLREKRHPTRYDLDQASTEHPIWIVHTSGHLGVANSRALALAGINKDTPQPKAGVIRKDPRTGEPNGVFEECGSLVSRRIPALSAGQRLQSIRWADAEYVSKGVTTTVIAGETRGGFDDLKRALAEGVLRLRVVAMIQGSSSAPASPEKAASLGGPPDRIRVGAVKLFQDGSIQGYTGYLSAPYYKQPEGKSDDRGYPRHSRDELTRMVKQYHRAGYQIAIHANGDAAIEDVLYAYREAQREFPRADARHRIEHCQTPREDQLDQMKELGVTPSFFVGHIYYWGDRHRDIFLGPQRAARISPLASARRRGLHFTLHNDTPVTPVNPLLLVSDAVNRLTRGGQVLGPDQRIPVMEALRAVTSDAAWQNFEEERKGSIETGKLADFVVLDRNPLIIPSAQIKAITVLETIIGGETVYRVR